jgi:hypothetical protein
MPVQNFEDGRLTPVDELQARDGDGSPKGSEQDAAATAEQQAQQVAGSAKQKAGEVASQAKDHAQAAAEQAKDKASAQVDERTTQLGRQVGSQAETFDGVADELRRQGKDGPAKVAEQAGQRVQGVAEFLEQADGEKLVDAASNFARENPKAAAAVGAAAGFAAGRVLKASTPDDDEPATQRAPGASAADPTSPAPPAAPPGAP